MAKKNQEEAMLHVGIKNPENIRRNILELSKGVIESLKNYERLNTTRDEKTEEIAKLRGELRALSKLIGSLKSELPKIKIEKPKVPVKKELIKKEKIVKKPSTELDKLEAELGEIEKKLSNI